MTIIFEISREKGLLRLKTIEFEFFNEIFFSHGKKLFKVKIEPPKDLFESFDFIEDTREDGEEEHYKFGRIWRDPTDECYEKVKELYDEFENLTKTE